VRRFLVVLVVMLFGCPLLASAAPPAFSAKPSVIVYPFTANGSQIDREASSQLATIIATQMANTGNVRVLPPPPGTDRKDFLAVARANNCDYYIAGFISALGNGVSVVEQVVSTTTGIVVFSNTAQLTTYADAAGQGDDLATFIVRHANRAYSSIGTPPPAAAPTSQPTSEASTNLGKLFGRKKKAPAKATATPAPAAPAATLVNTTPAPKPTAAPAVVAVAAAASGLAVVPVGGNADGALRQLAFSRLLEKSGAERVADAAAACGAHPHDAILTGSLWKSTKGPSFDLTATDCAGKPLWHGIYNNDGTGPQEQLAVERAVDAAVAAYLNPKRRKRG
jgi:TolB-like protein